MRDRTGAAHAGLRPEQHLRQDPARRIAVPQGLRGRQALAFLDIMPRATGHTLVIPKAPARNILDVDAGRPRACDAGGAEDRQGRDESVRRRRHHAAAVQRDRRRPGGVPPACPCHPAPGRRADEAAGEHKEKPEVLAEHAARSSPRRLQGPAHRERTARRRSAPPRRPKRRRTPSAGQEYQQSRSSRRQAARSGTLASAPGGKKISLRDHAGQDRGRDRPHPDQDLGALIEPAPSKIPSQRQISFGRKPTRISAR